MFTAHHFALWFSDVDVKFMMRDSGSTRWIPLHTLPLGAPNFLNEMNRFCDQVRKECDGDTYIIVFLADADIHTGSVSVIGRKPAARDQHVRRTLARQLGDQADNIVADYGNVNADKMAPVCFAQMDTLRAAERFVRDFGFRVHGFSTMSETGLDEMPCLMLPHQIERQRRINSVPKVSYAFRGAAAAMVAASVIIGTNIPDPNAVMMANILDAGNVPGQPVYVALHIGEIETPRVVETQNELAAFEPQKSMRIDTFPVAVRPGAGIVVADMRASRVMPTTRAASRMDAIAAHAGGFHVFVG